MDKESYTHEVAKVLALFSGAISERYQNVMSELPQEAVAAQLYVFVDQDGEGFLDVRVSLDGPNLHVLNKKIEEKAVLFETVMTEDGLERYCNVSHNNK